MKLSLLWVGRTRDPHVKALSEDYLGRIGRYCKVDVREVRENTRDNAASPKERTEREGRKVLKALRPGEYGIALDQQGREMTSEEFAAFLGKALEGHPSGVAVIIGGPYGLSDGVKETARQVISLSRMTLTHESARLIALEQLYRAFTIINGGKYHH